MMNLPYDDRLDIGKLSRIFDKKSESYKLFWFKAIMKRLVAGERQMRFADLIDDMICEAWYMVTEYHLNLGPSDAIEEVVNTIYQKGELKTTATPGEIKKYLHDSIDLNVINKRKALSYNVPYRLQAPFLQWKTGDWSGSTSKIAERINTYENVIYSFAEIHGMDSVISIDDQWANYFITNQEIIFGWIEYNQIVYLQKRNPNVPGIVDKLRPPQSRKLAKVINYWKPVVEQMPIYDLFSGQLLDEEDISIDHFVPWSYVAHDELWNLHPVSKAVNSSKNNNLPDWDAYFEGLARNEFLAYTMIWKNEKIQDAFRKCAQQHVNSDDIRERLYRQNLTEEQFRMELEKIIHPVYQSAQNLGFKVWRY